MIKLLLLAADWLVSLKYILLEEKYLSHFFKVLGLLDL